MIRTKLTSLCLRIAVFTTLLLATAANISAQSPEPDVIIIGGKVATMDIGRPTAEAIAIRGDRILKVGSNDAIRKLAGTDTQVIKLDGQFVMPGFIEGHAHFYGLGQSKMMLDLSTAKTWDDVVQQVADAAKTTPAGEWIEGRGWHQSKWTKKPEPNVEGYPTDKALSKISQSHPVLLAHASGHMVFANAYAMREAGITAETPNPKGGEILHDAEGNPIGIFRETAAGLLSGVRARAAAKRSDKEAFEYSLRAIELAAKECLENGITSFQDAGSSFATVDLLKQAADDKRLPIRLWVMIRDRNDLMKAKLASYKMIGYAKDFLTVRAVKRSIDGALGPHGAWLLAPYSDMPKSAGLNTATVESVKETAEIAIKNDFQVCVHAIGDRANREVLDIYEGLFKKYPSVLPRRWRIEHAQHLHPDDIPRFGKMGVIASMQAVHCTSDAVFVPKRLGMRRSKEGAYVWKSLMESGAVVTNGTDAPVEKVNPIASFYASVTRELADGVTFFPEQCMSRHEALKSYTIDCAYSAFEETQKGSLVTGKLADIVILSKDLLNCSDDEIMKTKVLYTIVGGKVKYQAK